MDLTGVMWVAMVGAAVGALGCVLVARPRSAGSVVAAAVMLVAMLDMAMGHVLLMPVVWAAALLALGVIVVALPAGASRCDWHHGVALVAAGVIMLVSLTVPPAAGAAGHHHLSLGGGTPQALGVAVVRVRRRGARARGSSPQRGRPGDAHRRVPGADGGRRVTGPATPHAAAGSSGRMG